MKGDGGMFQRQSFDKCTWKGTKQGRHVAGKDIYEEPDLLQLCPQYTPHRKSRSRNFSQIRQLIAKSQN